VGYSFVALFFPDLPIPADNSFKFMMAAFGASILFFFKQAFGPIIASILLAWAIVKLPETGEFEIFPVISWLLELVFSGLPPWVSASFLAVTTFYGIVGALYSSFADGI
jgi:hypothetical protein